MRRFLKLFYCALLAWTSSALYAETMLYPLQGDSIPFSSLNGKWVMLNYWASWCGPCLEEIPELNRFYAQNREKNLAMFGVNYDELPSEEQKQLVKQLHIQYPTLRQDPGSALALGSIDIVPVTFLFNPNGQLVAKLYGAQTARSLQKALAKY